MRYLHLFEYKIYIYMSILMKIVKIETYLIFKNLSFYIIFLYNFEIKTFVIM